MCSSCDTQEIRKLVRNQGNWGCEKKVTKSPSMYVKKEEQLFSFGSINLYQRSFFWPEGMNGGRITVFSGHREDAHMNSQ